MEMKSTYQLLPSDYNNVQVLFFRDDTSNEWFIDERSLQTLSGLETDEFARSLNHADFRQTSKGRWLVSLVDAYLILSEDARSWVHAEQFKNLPLRMNSGKRHDALLLSLEETARRYSQVRSIRASRGHRKEEHMRVIRERLEKNVRILAAYGMNENNSSIIQSVMSVLKAGDGNGKKAV